MKLEPIFLIAFFSGMGDEKRITGYAKTGGSSTPVRLKMYTNLSQAKAELTRQKKGRVMIPENSVGIVQVFEVREVKL